MSDENIRKFAGLDIDDSPTQKNGMFFGVFGPGGGGKTTTLARLVESPRITKGLLVDSEGGSSSVTHLKKLGLDVIHATQWSDVQRLRRELKVVGHGYDFVVWDHISELTNMYKMTVAPNGIPEIQQWGQILAQMMEFVREQRRLTVSQKLHVMYVAWEEQDFNKEDETLHFRVNLFKGFKAAFPGMVTMLGRMIAYEERPPYRRKLSFVAGERTDAKYRVAPDDDAASIPQELYLSLQNNFIVDFMNTVCYGEQFPSEKYGRKAN